MSIYPNVTEQGFMILRELGEQQKNQSAVKIEKKILRYTHGKKLDEVFEPITKLSDEVDESTKKLGEKKKKSNSDNENHQELALVEVK